MIRDFDTARSEPATEPAAGGTDYRTDFGTSDRITLGAASPDRAAATDRCATDDRRSIADLLKDLRDESSRLVRQEVALAKTELSEKTAKLGRNAGYAGVGAALAHAALILLLFGLSALLYWGLAELGLDNMIAGWLAPLIVGGLTALIGYALIQKAITAFKHETLVPEKTVTTLKENQEWLQRKATTA